MLVQSARRNCVEVWPCLTDLLRRIAAIAPDDTAALEEPYCQIVGGPTILSIGWCRGKKNPARLRPDADGNQPHVGSPSPNSRC